MLWLVLGYGHKCAYTEEDTINNEWCDDDDDDKKTAHGTSQKEIGNPKKLKIYILWDWLSTSFTIICYYDGFFKF